MSTDDITTIIPGPVEPMSIDRIINRLIQEDVEKRDRGLLEQLEIERAYNGVDSEIVPPRFCALR